MGRKKPNTPRSRVKSALRQLWMRSRERARALKSTGYRCTECNVKQSMAKGKVVKMEVHHLTPIEWEDLIDLVFERLLNVPQIPLCKPCHKLETEKQAKERAKRESSTGSKRSEKIMAASTSRISTGCRVTVAARSGRLQISRIPCLARMSLYCFK